MRLWSFHPSHLDARGLVALWREGLLARAVLLGLTSRYRQHPQLKRFNDCRDPVAALDCYLSRVLDEANSRGYKFDASKISYKHCRRPHAQLTSGQLEFEWKHLLEKLKVRDPSRWQAQHRQHPKPHGCFRVIPGPVSDWERN